MEQIFTRKKPEHGNIPAGIRDVRVTCWTYPIKFMVNGLSISFNHKQTIIDIAVPIPHHVSSSNYIH